MNYFINCEAIYIWYSALQFCENKEEKRKGQSFS